jgi:hypothetical protein
MATKEEMEKIWKEGLKKVEEELKEFVCCGEVMILEDVMEDEDEGDYRKDITLRCSRCDKASMWEKIDEGLVDCIVLENLFLKNKEEGKEGKA